MQKSKVTEFLGHFLYGFTPPFSVNISDFLNFEHFVNKLHSRKCNGHSSKNRKDSNFLFSQYSELKIFSKNYKKCSE